MDSITKALNLWDIEVRLNQIHTELEMLHEARASLLGDDYVHPDYSEREKVQCK